MADSIRRTQGRAIEDVVSTRVCTAVWETARLLLLGAGGREGVVERLPLALAELSRMKMGI